MSPSPRLVAPVPMLRFAAWQTGVADARAVIKGKARIDDATEAWRTATEANKGELRFFRVEVELS